MGMVRRFSLPNSIENAGLFIRLDLRDRWFFRLERSAARGHKNAFGDNDPPMIRHNTEPPLSPLPLRFQLSDHFTQMEFEIGRAHV